MSSDGVPLDCWVHARPRKMSAVFVDFNNHRQSRSLSSPCDSEFQRRPSSVVVPLVVHDLIKNSVLLSVKPCGFGESIVDCVKSTWHFQRFRSSLSSSLFPFWPSCDVHPSSFDQQWSTMSIHPMGCVVRKFRNRQGIM